MPANTPKWQLPYPLPTDQVSAGAADIQALATSTEAAIASPALAALPPGSGDGVRQLFAAPGYGFWEFVFSAAHGGWWCIGGSPMEVEKDAGTVYAGSWANIGVGITVPLAGVYKTSLGGGTDGLGGSPLAYLSATAPGWGPSPILGPIFYCGSGYGGWQPGGGSAERTQNTPALARGAVIGIAGTCDSGSANLRWMRLSVMPISTVGNGLAETEDELLADLEAMGVGPGDPIWPIPGVPSELPPSLEVMPA
jgi:hypothetical protein